MKKSILKYITAAITLLIVSTGIAPAQITIRSLEEQIRKAEEEIRLNTQLLNKTQKDQKASQTQLQLIQSRISNRREIANSLDKQIDLLNNDIFVKNKTVYGLNSDLEKTKKEYADMVREAHKNYKLNNFMLFLFAADDFNDVTRRINFMRRYNKMRVNKAAEIKNMSQTLANEIAELDTKKAELDQAKESKNKELANLSKDENQYKSTLTKLKSQESKISKDLKAKQAQIEKAQKEIQKLIAEEVKKSKTEVRTKAEDKYITELSGRFEDNKGKLPYPVRGGVVIEKFGKQAHSAGKGLIIDNNGIKIAGDRGTPVNCVFEGTVTSIVSRTGTNYTVLVKHGDYYSTYMNIVNLNVKKGDKIALNQQIGCLSNSSNDDDIFLFFGIWKMDKVLNPQEWLRR